jgi:hypothetical protein
LERRFYDCAEAVQARFREKKPMQMPLAEWLDSHSTASAARFPSENR